MNAIRTPQPYPLFRGILVGLSLCFLLCGVTPTWGQLEPCRGLLFSTEEDFLSRGNEPPDGNPIISDGDLLSIPNYPDLSTVVVCARNRDLLRPFQVRPDLGLDAVDAVDPKKPLIAFSTELDDPQGRFTAGDLLATNGAILPNVALLVKFDLPQRQDLGLDAIQFVGETDAITRLLELVRERGRDFWTENPGALVNILAELKVDILFSTEGTGPTPSKPVFLDGDLLSASSGTIAVSNADFLPALPAGLPKRGVDYGCDAFAIGHDPIENVRLDLFSTEIDSLARILSFTDGDILRQGNGVFLKNFKLIAPLEPRARDLGLDALDFANGLSCEEQVRITHLWETSVLSMSPDGYAPKDLGAAPDLLVKDRPFGDWIRIIGDLPGTDCLPVADYKYRVEFRPFGGSWQPIRTPDQDHPLDLAWLWEVPAAFPPGAAFNYQSDADGWIQLADYWKTKGGFRSLAVWNSRPKEGKHQLRLTLKKKSPPGTEVVSAEVTVFLDNQRPRNHANRPDIVLTGKFKKQCDIPASERKITIEGEIRDEHFLLYNLHWHGNGGGLNPIVTHFYDEGLPFLNGKGTQPAATNVVLGSVTIPSGIGCGFIRIRAQDRTIVGRFSRRPPGLVDLLYRDPTDWESYDWESFCFRSENEGGCE